MDLFLEGQQDSKHETNFINFKKLVNRKMWRCGGLVVSVTDFQPKGWWLEPGLCHCVVSFFFFHQIPLFRNL